MTTTEPTLRERPLVLIVEDIELNRDLVEQILEDDYDLAVACDGIEAVRAARDLNPDLILMDLSLPGIDGWEATRRIRAMPQLARTPILALTAHAMVGDRETALAAGCDDFLTKPIDEDLLLAKVGEWLVARPVTSEPVTAEPDAATPDRDGDAATPVEHVGDGAVLVVDDLEDARELLRVELEAEGFEVRVCQDARAGLAALADRAPEVVVLDLEMPDMDGIELCRRIRELHGDRVMVMFCSAHSTADKKSLAFDAGATEYLTRPYDAIELTARVRAMVRLRRAYDALATERDAALEAARAVRRDRLTRVWDRTYLFEWLEEEMGKPAGRALSAILLAVDDVDALRALHGDVAVDHALRQLASMILDHTGGDDVVCRYGDAEFMIVVPDLPLDAARVLAERLCRRAQTFGFAGDAHGVQLTASCGVGYFDATATRRAVRAVRAADVALFFARRTGTGQVRTFEA